MLGKADVRSVSWVEAHEFHELKAGDSCDYKASGGRHKGIVCASGFLGEQLKTML